ncbi:conserved hypothetical protein (plasmid) [Borreliella burgdorferi 94a]|nr:conserved hypothetical protein [Borreliella burgdorferi 94a]
MICHHYNTCKKSSKIDHNHSTTKANISGNYKSNKMQAIFYYYKQRKLALLNFKKSFLLITKDK